MIEPYLVGSIKQSLERVRQLRGIVHKHHSREYDGLRQICLGRLDQVQLGLDDLLRERIVDWELQSPLRVRKFKRLVEDLNNIEGIGVFALLRTREEDDFLNRLITDLCREISYPLVNPVVSHISQDYFHIYPGFNLLCLPLIESRFLLHLPDIYHELCHALHRQLTLPQLEPYYDRYKDALFCMVAHYDAEIVAAERLRNQDARIFQIKCWQSCWIKFWMEELFCDLFGVYAAGPAFVWAHYHLCVKRGSDPFRTPQISESTHPADSARMYAHLKMLRLRPEYVSEASQIEAAWREYLSLMDFKSTPEYLQCFSEPLLDQIVTCANTGVTQIGISLADGNGEGKVRALLNNAWKEFWRDPGAYGRWELERVSDLQAFYR